jgi:hypothetical protein
VAQRYGLSIYTRSVRTRGGWPGDLHRWAVDHLPLAKYRLVLADPEALVDGLRDELPTTYDDVIDATGWTIEPDGHIRSTGTWNGDPRFLDAIGDAEAIIGGQWRIDDHQRDVLRAQFRRLEDRGVQVVVVIPPVTDDLEAAFPGGTDGFADYVAEARSVGDGTGTLTVDLSGEDYPDDLFRDTHHLNQQGSDRLTGEVADALAGAAFPRCDGVRWSP